MPLYDYKCKDHGVFHELATMAQSGLPKACPQCKKLSARIIMIPPEILAMAPSERKAHEHNERAIHQPIISNTNTRAEAEDKRNFYQKKCGCSSHEQSHAKPKIIGAAPTTSALQQKAIYLADGSKVFPSQRPWMISH